MKKNEPSTDDEATSPALPTPRSVWMDAATKTRLFLLTSADAARLAPGSFVIVSLDTGQQKKTSKAALAPFETSMVGLRESVETQINVMLGPALWALQTALVPHPPTDAPRSPLLPAGAALSEAEGARALLNEVARSLEASAGSGSEGNQENAGLVRLIRQEVEKIPLGETPLPVPQMPEGLAAGLWENHLTNAETLPPPDAPASLPAVDVAYILAAFDEMPETG